MLGDKSNQFHFRSPGAYHQARWMAKGIYCLKIFALRHQFNLSKHELQGIRRIVLFTVTIYIRMWVTAHVSMLAPSSDLLLLQMLEQDAEVDYRISQEGTLKMRGHLWYLSENLVCLALFNDHLPIDLKRKLVSGLSKPAKPNDVRRVVPTAVATFLAVELTDFVTSRSLNIFQALKLPEEFLSVDPEMWAKRTDYRDANSTFASC